MKIYIELSLLGKAVILFSARFLRDEGKQLKVASAFPWGGTGGGGRKMEGGHVFMR